jgi:hypothetical protein
VASGGIGLVGAVLMLLFVPETLRRHRETLVSRALDPPGAG